jgi:hypothetical protein
VIREIKAENASGAGECVYLFQTDPAKNNRPFFEGMRKSTPESVYFRGLDLSLVPGKPDGVRIDLAMREAPRCSLALIELEPTEAMARAKASKYLRESSVEICNVFTQYLNKVIEDCESRADPRQETLASLRDALGGSAHRPDELNPNP